MVDDDGGFRGAECAGGGLLEAVEDLLLGFGEAWWGGPGGERWGGVEAGGDGDEAVAGEEGGGDWAHCFGHGGLECLL